MKNTALSLFSKVDVDFEPVEFTLDDPSLMSPKCLGEAKKPRSPNWVFCPLYPMGDDKKTEAEALSLLMVSHSPFVTDFPEHFIRGTIYNKMLNKHKSHLFTEDSVVIVEPRPKLFIGVLRPYEILYHVVHSDGRHGLICLDADRVACAMDML